ncbi:MAG: arylsulfotransferase family protein [Paracoccaceae bacterium]
MPEPRNSALPVPFWLACLVLAAVASFALGIWSELAQNAVYRFAANFLATTSGVASQVRNNTTRPAVYLQPVRKPGEGVTVNAVGNDGELVLMASFWDGQTGLRLMRRDGTVVAKWPVLHSQDFPDKSAFGETAPQTDRNVDLHGAVINPDGSVVFNYEYAGTVKLSRCGKVEWSLAEPTHHSVETTEKGGYWIPGRRFIANGSANPDEQFVPFTLAEHEGPVLDDLILRVSDDGTVLERKSVMRIFYDSGLKALMTGTGDSFRPDRPSRPELVHLNKIAELPASMAAAFPMFKAGDLLISLRQHNMIAVIDPVTWRVKWYKTGPYLRQHDPHWRPDGSIALFNNNIFRTSLGPEDTFIPGTPEVSEVMGLDPATGRTWTTWGNRPGQEMVSVIRGAIDPSPHGGYLVTEFEGGRAFEFDASGRIVWEYINRYDEASVAEITTARLYSESWFTVKDWTCPAP